MPFKNGNIPENALDWPPSKITQLKENWGKMTNRELAASLGYCLTSVRTKCYELGLKRMELEYWTPAQIKFLLANYKTIGDKELAIMFNKKWKKKKGWTHKHIEKKRRYLKLNRTEKQKKAIHQRNVDRGAFLLCPVKRWLTTGQAKEKEIRMWREQSGRFIPRIKIKGRFIHWARWYWEKYRGKIPEGMNVSFKDNNPANYKAGIKNLELLSDADMARKNVAKSSHGLSDNYVVGIMTHKNKELRKQLKQHPELIELKRQSLLLNRTINEQRKAS
jgi:HNH endonuclease